MSCLAQSNPCDFLKGKPCVGIVNRSRMLNVAWHYCRISDYEKRQYCVSIPAFYHMSKLHLDRQHHDPSTIKEYVKDSIPSNGICSFWKAAYEGLANCSGLCHDVNLGSDDGCKNTSKYKNECLERYECGCDVVLYYTDAVVREGINSEDASFRGFLVLLEYMDGTQGVIYEVDNFKDLTANEISPFISLYQYIENCVTIMPHTISVVDQQVWGVGIRSKIVNNNMYEYRNVLQKLNGVSKTLNLLANGYSAIMSIHSSAISA